MMEKISVEDPTTTFGGPPPLSGEALVGTVSCLEFVAPERGDVSDS